MSQDNKLMQVSGMSDVELQSISESMVAQFLVVSNERMKRMESELKSIVDRIEKNDQSVQNEIQSIKDEQQKVLDVAINSMRVNQPKYDYVRQGEFGRFFDVSIGSGYVGKLFRIVGLAQKGKSRTIPYRSKIPQYAKVITSKEFESYVWHFNKCMDAIDEWLKKHGYYTEFYSIETEKEMYDFINDLHMQYVDPFPDSFFY